MSWSRGRYSSWHGNGFGGDRRYNSGYSYSYKRGRDRVWPKEGGEGKDKEKVLWCKCNNWMYAHREHTHCPCGELWRREDGQCNSKAGDSGRSWWDAGYTAAPELSIDTLVEALEKLCGKDVRAALVNLLPLPKAVEEKMATEADAFGDFRKHRQHWSNAKREREKAKKGREAAQKRLDEAAAKLAKLEAEEKAAEEIFNKFKQDYYENFPHSTKEKEARLLEADEEEESDQEGEQSPLKKQRGEEPKEEPEPGRKPEPVPAAASHWSAWSGERGGIGISVGDDACDDGMGCGGNIHSGQFLG